MKSESVATKAATSAVYVGLSQVFRIGLSVLSTVVVARLLTPSDFGVIAMVAPVTAFILMFQDLGLSQAAIQAKTLSQKQSSSLFWLNVAASVGLTTGLLAFSPLVAMFYGDNRAGYIAAASALTILVAGTGLQHSALLNREMRFRSIALIDIAYASSTFLATAFAALLLRNYWALWIGSLTGGLVYVALLWSSSGWRPDLKPSFKGAGEMVKFGTRLSASNLVNFLIRNADNVLIAKVSGAAQLGLYDRSYKLMMLPLVNISAPLGRVMLPTLRKLKEDPVAYRRTFLVASRALMLFLNPGIAVSAATSKQLIPLLLGSRWAEAAPIFFWLSLTGLVQPLPNATGWLFITSGRVAAQLRWSIFSAVVTLAGFAIGIRYGAEGVAASLFVTALARVPLLYWYSTKGTSVSATDLYRSMVEPFSAAVITYCVVFASSAFMPIGPLLLCGLLLGYALTLGLYALTAGGRDILRTLVRLSVSALHGIKRETLARTP